ncbi:MAG: SDR family NAD(P)-dependent oxidoreductase [Mesorhizobium sp.]|nr:SDR family NAD(P)-dependent oxidoreductase [Mesorhizobium sp.]
MTDEKGLAVVIGASGGIGSAIAARLEQDGTHERVIRLSRSSTPPLDLLAEETIAEAARCCAGQGDIRLVIDATGFLHDDDAKPEKSLRDLDADRLARNFALNAIGPALLMKHFLPILPRDSRATFATLSAKVGSIADNRLGGWYGYRASKAALNQLVRTAAIELARSHRHALCVAVHPGTVDTELSAPFAKAGLALQTPQAAAAAIVAMLDSLPGDANGGFFDRSGERLPW